MCETCEIGWPFFIPSLLSMFKAPIFEIWYFKITWMTEFLKEKGIQFSKIIIFIDQLGHITCEIRKFWRFFDIFCSFCELINQTFFQASEWLKETHSCWVWHFCNVKKILMGLHYVWNLWIWLTLFYSFLFSVLLKHHIWNNMNDWKLLSVLSFLSFWAIWNWYLNLFPWKSIHSHF